MNNIKVTLKITRPIGAKLALVKLIKEHTGMGLRDAKDVMDSLVNNHQCTLMVGKHFFQNRTEYYESFGIRMEGDKRKKLHLILNGEIILNDTMSKFEAFIESVDEKDAIGLEIFKTLLPLLKEHPFDTKDSVRDMKTKIETLNRNIVEDETNMNN